MNIEFKSYTPDGPGYCGPITVELNEQSVTVTTNGREAQFSTVVPLPQEIPGVATVFDMAPTDAASIWAHLDEAARDYLETHENIPLDRVKLITYADASKGFLIIHGESCYMSLVAGELHFNISEGEATTYAPITA